MIRPNPKKKSKPVKRRSQRTYCDTLWSLFIRARAKGRCQRCGRTGLVLQAAHIIRRNVLPTRWHPDNGVGLCSDCHRLFDNPASELERRQLIRDWIGDAAYADLLALAAARWDRDYSRTLRELKQLRDAA